MTTEIETTDATETNTFNVATHNGYITVQSVKTGDHRTFQIKTAQSGPLEGQRIVSLLTGPDRDDYRCWTGFGTVNSDGVVRVWRKFQCQPGFERTNHQKYAAYLTQPERYTELGLLRFIFSSRCRRCNRTLTTPESCAAGIGPDCAGRDN